MTPEKRAALETQLNEQGLSVLLTRDYDAILLQLARLAQFERLMLRVAESSPLIAIAIHHIQNDQRRFADCSNDADANGRLLTVLDIPEILCELNRSLHAATDTGRGLCPDLIRSATAAFIGILCPEV